ncbi:MAG: DNA polymerase III subunit delta', partial [Acidimicrobiales bacterium]
MSSYLFVGAPGSGKLAIAVDFAAALLCQDGGCGQCETCRSVTTLGHPDVLVFRRSGSNLEISEAREIVQLAQTRPQFGGFRVIIVPEMHRGVHVSSTLLKIVEEPPVTTIFLLTAEGIDRALEPLASRCVRISVPRPERATV